MQKYDSISLETAKFKPYGGANQASSLIIMSVFVKKQYFSLNQYSLLDPNFDTSIMSLSKLALSGHIITISHDCSHRGGHDHPKTTTQVTK